MELYTYNSYNDDTPEKGISISYGDLKQEPVTNDVDLDKIEDKENLYLMPKLLSGGDYANSSTIEISNHRVFLEKFKEVPGVFDVWGGYGTFAIAIRLDVYLSNDEIKEIIDGLENHALIDNDDLSELEMEKTDESWENYERKNSLEKLRESHPSLANLKEPKYFRYYFDNTADEKGEYWESEQGGSMYINVDNVIPALRDRALVSITPDEDLPLLVGHEWRSDNAQTIYEDRLNGTHVPSKDDWVFQLEKEEVE